MTDRLRKAFGFSPILLVAVFAIVVLLNAWVCDDAYISFRTVDNFVHGYGLTWNIAERVQTYTHPLWLFLMIPFYAVTGEVYFTVIIISVILAVAAVAIYAFKIAASPWAAVFGVAALTLSAAFVDFSTSGLENPLTFFLLALFLFVYFRADFNIRSLVLLSFIASLGAVNRLDTILMFAPMLVYTYLKTAGNRKLWYVVLGLTPLIAWELFSLIYYGFPFPNTAHAKLKTGLDRVDVWTQGIYYLLYSLRVDPLTMVIIVGSIIAPFISRQDRSNPATAAVVVYLVYIINIGGCFMSGRYLAAPMFLAVVLLSQYRNISRLGWSIALLGVLALGLATGDSPLHAGKSDKGDPAKVWHGIVGERSWYNPTHGLINYWSSQGEWPSHHWIDEGKEARRKGLTFIPHVAVGMVGFYAGPQAYILDVYAITDPLLARLPVCEQFTYRVGHFGRIVPPGYKRTIITGTNQITDSSLAAYYDRLSLLTRGTLLSPGRLWEIVRFNLTLNDYLVDDYTSPHLVRVEYADVSAPPEEGVIGIYADNYRFYAQGLEINLGETSHAPQFELTRDFNDAQRAIFLREGKETASGIIPAAAPRGGLSRVIVTVPAPAVAEGYDKIKIVPESSPEGFHSIRRLRLLPSGAAKDDRRY